MKIYGIIQLDEIKAMVRDLTPAEISLFTYLICHCGPKDHCYPSRKTMAEDFNCSTSIISRHVASLKNKGYLEIKKVSGNRNNYYPLKGSFATVTEPSSSEPEVDHYENSSEPEVHPSSEPEVHHSSEPEVIDHIRIEKNTKKEDYTEPEKSDSTSDLKKVFDASLWEKWKAVKDKDNYVAGWKRFKDSSKKVRDLAVKHADRYLKSVEDRDQQFIPTVASYISNERWNEISTEETEFEKLEKALEKLEPEALAERNGIPSSIPDATEKYYRARSLHSKLTRDPSIQLHEPRDIDIYYRIKKELDVKRNKG